MDATVLVIFGLVYLGMILGEIPGLALDRSGIALLGAIALVATAKIAPDAAWAAIDVPTMALLFGLMVVSAQLRLGGFYTRITRALAGVPVPPSALLALVIAVAGVLSALLANDIICLALAPLLVEGCARRGLDPVPFLLALAGAANVGSAATLIGNPQNMLIGQRLGLSFTAYMADAAAPSLLGLGAVWLVIHLAARGRWRRDTLVPSVAGQPFDRWQTAKGLAVLAALVALFLLSSTSREVVAMTAAGVLLLSRRMASRDFLGLVDWNLLVLFLGLFVVNRALADSGWLAAGIAATRAQGVDLAAPPVLFAVTVVLSNLVSNVPAVMLLLPTATHPLGGAVLALASTLAGNLFIVGSIANIIVVEQARALGVRIGWREHARIGIPVTLLTLAIAAAWLALRA